MLFFQSEERVNERCREHEIPRRPILSLEQLWQLAVAWYDALLTREAPSAEPRDQIRRIFARIGLQGPFWDSEFDQSG